MELLRLELTGGPVRVLTEDSGSAAAGQGLLGVDVTGRAVDGSPRTVVQVLFDDDLPGFDRSLLDDPIVAELIDPDGRPVAREPLDHDAFRRRLNSEREAGESVTRGVLVLTDGEPPPPWVRLGFLPIGLTETTGTTLVLRRTTVDALVEGVEVAYREGAVTDNERDGLLTVIAQLHPTG